MPARVQPESLLILSRQRLVALLIKRSNVKGAAGNLLKCEKSWVSWLEVATTLLTPSMTNTILAEVMAGLDNKHSCSLLAPLLSPRLTILKLPDLPPDLPEAELVDLFERLPSCSSLQNIQFGTQVAAMPSVILCLYLIFTILPHPCQSVIILPLLYNLDLPSPSDPGEQPAQPASLHAAAGQPPSLPAQPHPLQLQHPAPLTAGGLDKDDSAEQGRLGTLQHVTLAVLSK